MNKSEIIRIRMAEMGHTYITLSNATGIKLRTLKRYIANPDIMRIGDLRAIHNRLRFSDAELIRFGKSK